MRAIEKELQDYDRINHRHMQAGHKEICLYANQAADILKKAGEERPRFSDGSVEAITYAYRCGVAAGYRARLAEEKDNQKKGDRAE